MVSVGPASGFGNNFIHTAELHQVFGSDAQRLSGNMALGGVAPHDGSTTLGRNHGIDGVLQHQDAVSNGDRERSAASAFAGDGSDDGNLQPSHLPHAAGNGLRLSALLSA